MRFHYVMILLLLMPFAFSELSISGKGNLPGFAEQTDRVTLTIDLFMPGQPSAEVVRNQIEIRYGDERFNPDQCVPKDQIYACTYSEDIVNFRGEREYIVEVRNADGGLISTESTFVVIDSQSPRILTFKVVPEISSSNNFSFILEAQDYADELGNTLICTGFKEIKITANGRDVLELDELGCKVKIADTLPIVGDGEIEVCAIVLDKVNLEDKQCQKIILDNTPPTVKRIGFVDREGTFLTHIPRGGAEFRFALEATDLSGINSIRVDMGDGEGFKEPATQYGDIYVYHVVNVQPSTECKATVNSVDGLGNTREEEMTCVIEVDETPPEYLGMLTDFEDIDGNPVLGRTSTLRVLIKELGAGLNKGNVFIDFTPLGLPKTKADKCVKRDNWECFFYNVTPRSAGDYLLKITATDDLNQKSSDEEYIQATLDMPVITKIEQSPNFVTSQDDIQYVLTVQSLADVTLELETSEDISTASFPQDGNCEIESTSGQWVCVVTLGSLSRQFVEGEVTFTIRDELGNKVTNNHPIIVYETGLAGEIDFFTLSRVTISPSKVDKSVASQVAYPVYIRPSLSTSATDIEILDSVIACDMEYIVDGPRILYGSTTHPYISIKLDRSYVVNMDNDSADQIQIPCSLELTVKKGNTVFPERELEEFVADIIFEGSQFGTIDENIQKKLSDIDTSIMDIEDKIDGWEEINEALGAITDVASLAAQIDAVFSFVSTVIWGITSIMYHTGILTGPAGSFWQSTCDFYVGQSGSTGLHHLLNLIVWYPGSAPGQILLPLPKNAAIIQSCQMCGMSGLYTVAVPKTEGDILVNMDGASGSPTTLEAFATFNWEPYKSIHVAQACFCPPAIEYNLKKERQVRCIYKNCVKESAQLGLPFSHCDRTFFEQNCLYVDSAAWKVAGGAAIAAIIRDLAATALAATPVMLAGTAWTVTCNPISSVLGEAAYNCQSNGGDPLIDWAVPVCGAWSGGLELAETEFFGDNLFGWDTFNGRLEGEDFCVG